MISTDVCNEPQGTWYRVKTSGIVKTLRIFLYFFSETNIVLLTVFFFLETTLVL